MAEMPPPAGSGLDGYFATGQPQRPPATPYPPPPAGTPAYGPPVGQGPPAANQFGTSVNQFGTPVNQFGTPVGQYPPPAGAAPTGWSPYPVAAPAGSNKKTLLIIGGSIVAVVLMVVAAVGVYFHNQHSLSLPTTLNNQPQITDPSFDIVRRGLVDELKADGARSAVVGFYGVPGQPYAMVLAARGPSHSGDANSALTSLEAGMMQTAPLTNMTDVGTGKFHGRMQCGEANLNNIKTVPVCVWADDTVGVEFLYTTAPSDAPATALTIRQSIEH